MRNGGRHFTAPAAMANPAIYHQHQRGGGIGIERGSRIRVCDGQVIHGKLRALAAFTRPADPVTLILAQQGHKVGAGQQRSPITHGAVGKARAGRADLAIGIDDCGGNSGKRQGPAELAIKLDHEISNRIGNRQRTDLPHQEVIAAPGAQGLAAPARAASIGKHPLDQIGAALAIAPAAARCTGKPIERGGIHRQARRGMGGAEPLLVTGIGANQPPRPVGNGDGRVGTLDRCDGDGPIR